MQLHSLAQFQKLKSACSLFFQLFGTFETYYTICVQFEGKTIAKLKHITTEKPIVLRRSQQMKDLVYCLVKFLLYLINILQKFNKFYINKPPLITAVN